MTYETSSLVLDFKSLSLNSDTFNGIISNIRPWKFENLARKDFSDGITNKIFGFFDSSTSESIFDAEDALIVRINGEGTDKFLDRNREIENMCKLNSVGVAAKVHVVFRNGMCYDFTKGKHITRQQVTDAKIGCLIAKNMAKCHEIEAEGTETAACWHGINKFLDQVEEFQIPSGERTYNKEFVSSSKKKLKAFKLKSKLSQTLKFCHNDLLLGNILFDEVNNRVNFIDHEYADFNIPTYDIANHFAEWAGLDVDWSFLPNDEQKRSWMKAYKEFDDQELERVLDDLKVMSLVCHLYWGIWAVVQSQISKIDFDYAGYAKTKFDRLIEEDIALGIL